jgi:hypothetical protein
MKPRWNSLMEKVSARKLLSVASTTLCENPNTATAAKKSAYCPDCADKRLFLPSISIHPTVARPGLGP